jgi:hypothetical protein
MQFALIGCGESTKFNLVTKMRRKLWQWTLCGVVAIFACTSWCDVAAPSQADERGAAQVAATQTLAEVGVRDALPRQPSLPTAAMAWVSPSHLLLVRRGEQLRLLGATPVLSLTLQAQRVRWQI